MPYFASHPSGLPSGVCVMVILSILVVFDLTSDSNEADHPRCFIDVTEVNLENYWHYKQTNPFKLPLLVFGSIFLFVVHSLLSKGARASLDF